MTDDELRQRIEIARAAPQAFFDKTFYPDDPYMDLPLAFRRHVQANSPDAVIALCTELLAAREEIRTLVQRLINAGDPP